MSEAKEFPPQSEVKPEFTGVFGGRFSRLFVECINGSLQEIIPNFSRNGMPPEEKDLYRTTLVIRFLTHSEVEMRGAGKIHAAHFLAALKEMLMKEQEKIYNSLRGEDGTLPSEIEGRLASVREAEL